MKDFFSKLPKLLLKHSMGVAGVLLCLAGVFAASAGNPAWVAFVSVGLMFTVIDGVRS